MKRSMCLEQRDGGGDGEEGGQGGHRAGPAAPWGLQGGFGLFPQGGGNPWTAVGRGQDLTEVLTGALWWPLRGGPTVGGEVGSLGLGWMGLRGSRLTVLELHQRM